MTFHHCPFDHRSPGYEPPHVVAGIWHGVLLAIPLWLLILKAFGLI
ncbi:MAG: hypothetical protein KGM17_05300 [Sphingomonadales bacterium]|nr:hypothetical protein [Sphingomonadales bacterium]